MSSKTNTLFVRSNKPSLINHLSNHLPSYAEVTNESTNQEVLEIIEINHDDDLDELDGSSSHPSHSVQSSRFSIQLSSLSRPIDLNTAKELKNIVLGSSTAKYGPQWAQQYFEFQSPKSQVWYSLIQKKGGPCGVLAALQSYLCAEIFHQNKIDPALKSGILTGYLTQCLACAVGNILWQIGGNRQKVIVAYESNANVLDESGDFKPDGITERIRLCEFFSQSEMSQFLSNLFSHQPYSVGCVSLTYSCILTRGLDQIKQDYDCGSIESLLITEQLLCSQELVNLCLVGRAVSNVFDRNFNCNDVILQGITRQSVIGFLTLHEHNGAFKVGSCYKNPKLPIFVVLSEGHFTTLFNKSKSTGNKFDLFYYDTLIGQDKEIRLTIDLQPNQIVDGNECDTTVPLECVIRTKWPNAHIDWNGMPKLF